MGRLMDSGGIQKQKAIRNTGIQNTEIHNTEIQKYRAP